MMIQLTCDHCGQKFERQSGQYKYHSQRCAHVYCSRKCAGLARRLTIDAETKKALKAEYDRNYRATSPTLRQRRAESYRRNVDREKEKATRQKRMPLHVEYCRRPEYKAKKVVYDAQLRASEYGEYAECYRLLIMLEREICARATKNERYRELGIKQWDNVKQRARRLAKREETKR